MSQRRSVRRAAAVTTVLTVGAVLAALIPSLAAAQVTSSLQQIALGAIKGQVVTLSAPSPSSQGTNIVDDGISVYPSPFTTTVAWDVANSTTTTVKLVAYFPTPAQALALGTSYIPSSAFEASTDGGSTWAPFTGNAVGGVGSAGGSLVLFTSPVTEGAAKSGSQAVTFQLRLNLTGFPTTTAGIYSGLMYLMAIAN